MSGCCWGGMKGEMDLGMGREGTATGLALASPTGGYIWFWNAIRWFTEEVCGGGFESQVAE